jgi:hypothetical protein
VKKLIIGLMLAAGCGSGTPVSTTPTPASGPAMPTGNVTGAATGPAAIEAFMAAIKAQDLQALGAIWGTPNGPARDRMSSDVLQERELTMICYLHHDSYTVLSNAPTMDGRRTYAVQVKYKGLQHTGQFDVGKATDGRYYVISVVNFPEFQDFCGAK